jgi:hypothetical protein
VKEKGRGSGTGGMRGVQEEARVSAALNKGI